MNRFKAAWDALFSTRDALLPGSARDIEPYLGGANNLFGSIAKGQWPISTRMDFIPVDANSDVLGLGGTNVDASWLGLSGRNMQYWAYIYCSPLSAVIDRLAEADTNGRIELVNVDGTPKEYKKNPKLYRIMKLLAKPNPYQTWEEFNSEQVVLCKIFGYCPVFAIGGNPLDRSLTKSLWNLSPYYATPELDDNYSLFEEISNPIKSWNITIASETYNIPAEDIILVKDGFIEVHNPRPYLPISKIAGLDYFISNICAAMEADNVLLKKKGPLGIFSHDPKPDMAGWLPMTPEQQDELQNDLKKYGLTIGQLQYVVSKQPIKWNAMSFNVQELMTKETVRQGIDGICDRFGYPAELMSGKNATYENRNSAEKFMYQNNVIPFSLRRMAKYNTFFNIEDAKLNLNYQHLPVLQEDIVKAGTARLANSQALNIDWMAGLISYNEYRKGLNLAEVAGKEKYYYTDWLKDNQPEEPQQPANGKKKPLQKAA